MKAILLLLLPHMLLALADPQPSPSESCEPGYWFREQITLEQVPLPPGISLSVLEAEGAERAGISLENHTSELLFVLSRQYQKPLEEPATPDPNYAARLRYAHEVASYLVTPEGERSLSMEALLDLDPDLQEVNRLDASRPTEEMVLVPAAQQSMLLMVYGNQVVRVPFTVTYSLNPEYAPDNCGEQETAAPSGTPTQSTSEKSASDVQRGLPGLALLVLIVAAILGANLISRYARRL